MGVKKVDLARVDSNARYKGLRAKSGLVYRAAMARKELETFAKNYLSNKEPPCFTRLFHEYRSSIVHKDKLPFPMVVGALRKINKSENIYKQAAHIYNEYHNIIKESDK